MIILDFETNTHNIGDVIEVAAVKVKQVKQGYEVIDKFHRYYLSRYNLNYHSYKVHRLTPELILDYRKDKTYASYFREDEDFIEFCKGVTTLVAHNINFEQRHLKNHISFSNYICTMKEHKYLLNLLDKRGVIKNPSLDEVCGFYGINFDKLKHHSATYDVSKTYEILNFMKV